MYRFLLVLVLLFAPVSRAAELKPIVIPPGYEHDKWATQPRDIVKEFCAFTVSFDSADDDDADEIADVWAIPHWVAQEIKRFPGELGPGPARPDWMTDKALHEAKIAPADASYHFSEVWREEHPTSKFLGYDRGHMCMKQLAFRIGANADWNTHTLLNACPQREDLNQGIWLDLEIKTGKWADRFERVWVITGPVVYGRKPLNWLGQASEGEVMVAIPDAFFKIVIRQGDPLPHVLAFIYPQRGVDYRVKSPQKHNHIPYLTNVNAIEHFTGLNFLSTLSDADQEKIEKETATELWPE
jgi:DNA/RNA endonuclease G (NUC1)